MMRGIDSRQEVDPGLLLRDTRTMGQRIADFFGTPVNISVVLVSAAGAAYFAPYLSDVILIFGVLAFLYAYTRKQTLPFRLPQRAKVKDYNDLKPGSNKPFLARGITHLGNDRKTNEELWFGNEDMRTHVLIFGSTGSGKTEALISFAYSALLQSSGFIYVDGKGDNTLYAKVFSMLRSLGREDDLLVVNFMTGARDIVGPQEKRLSNTLNPFSTGSSSMLSQLVVSLMDSSSQSSDGDMWKGRAISFVEALMKVLVYMRDRGAILLDANTIRNYFLLPKLEAIVMDHQFLRDGQEPVSLEGVPEVVLEPIKNYVFNLPGYNKEKKGKQVSQVLEQHGFITMQLTRVFTSLADTYGHIIRTNLAEVDFKDVVVNRRVLVVLLPALEKSPDELANLGKVIIASLKAMMAAGLGEEVEGEYRDVVGRKPTNAPTPYLCILDEYGYYAVQGFAVVPAQARSLGFSTIFAGQDLPAFQKASKEEAASIGANTNIKICMKLEDPTETWEFFTKTAGEAYVTKVDAFQTKETSMTNSYLDTKSSSFEKRARVDLLDLKEQGLGEAHIFFKSKIIRARTFFANPKIAKDLRMNHFLKVEPPPDQVLYDLQERTKQFQGLMKSGDIFVDVQAPSEDIYTVREALHDNEFLDPIERAVAALIAYHSEAAPEEIEEEIIEHEPSELNIFTSMRSSELLDRVMLGTQDEQFTRPILERAAMRGELDTLERVSGKIDTQAANIARELIRDMQSATHYPPEYRDDITPSDLANATLDVVEKIRAARTKGEPAS
jgi:intracellular multiplication protein IcmO